MTASQCFSWAVRDALPDCVTPVNQVVSKRMVKQQQVGWTKHGAHRLLQARVQVLNDDLRTTFGAWYAEWSGPSRRWRRQPDDDIASKWASPRFVNLSSG